MGMQIPLEECKRYCEEEDHRIYKKNNWRLITFKIARFTIKLITPIAKLNKETMSVLTSIGILSKNARGIKAII